MEKLINENPNDFITIYKDVEKAIRKTFQEEQTKQDKEFFLKDINRVITELYRVLEE